MNPPATAFPRRRTPCPRPAPVFRPAQTRAAQMPRHRTRPPAPESAREAAQRARSRQILLVPADGMLQTLIECKQRRPVQHLSRAPGAQILVPDFIVRLVAHVGL